MDATQQPVVSDDRRDEAVAPPVPYVKPELRDYGRLQPRLQFTPPNPP